MKTKQAQFFYFTESICGQTNDDNILLSTFIIPPAVIAIVIQRSGLALGHELLFFLHRRENFPND
jgi:hypothetical protein